MQLLGKIPKKVYLACSGGKDSMTILEFLLQGRRDVTLLFCHHGTEHSEEASLFLSQIAEERGLTLHTTKYTGNLNFATEASWREFRYSFFSQFTDYPIITGHHLRDNIETWLMSSISGTSKFIPYSRDNIIRPFLLSFRRDLDKYANNHNVKWVEDKSNSENKYSRNKIRNLVFPVLEDINPGIETVFYYKCLDKYERDGVI